MSGNELTMSRGCVTAGIDRLRWRITIGAFNLMTVSWHSQKERCFRQASAGYLFATSGYGQIQRGFRSCPNYNADDAQGRFIKLTHFAFSEIEHIYTHFPEKYYKSRIYTHLFFIVCNKLNAHLNYLIKNISKLLYVIKKIYLEN